MNTQWKSKIEGDIKNNEIMVYMRGTPQAPRCGFSAKVIRTLNELGRPFQSNDMDSDPELWSTLKEMNNWPTSPQIFIKGESWYNSKGFISKETKEEIKHNQDVINLSFDVFIKKYNYINNFDNLMNKFKNVFSQIIKDNTLLKDIIKNINNTYLNLKNPNCNSIELNTIIDFINFVKNNNIIIYNNIDLNLKL